MIGRAIWFHKYGEFFHVVAEETGQRPLTEAEKSHIHKFIKLSRGKVLSRKEIEIQTTQNLLSQYGGDYKNGWLWVNNFLGNTEKPASSFNCQKLRLMLRAEYPRHFKKHFAK